jgi:hypothetical protein
MKRPQSQPCHSGLVSSGPDTVDHHAGTARRHKAGEGSEGPKPSEPRFKSRHGRDTLDAVGWGRGKERRQLRCAAVHVDGGSGVQSGRIKQRGVRHVLLAEEQGNFGAPQYDPLGPPRNQLCYEAQNESAVGKEVRVIGAGTAEKGYGRRSDRDSRLSRTLWDSCVRDCV